MAERNLAEFEKPITLDGKNTSHIPHNEAEFRDYLNGRSPGHRLTESLMSANDLALALMERSRLLKNPVYKGQTEPKGKGQRIAIAPGFATIPEMYDDPKRYFGNDGFSVGVYEPRTKVNVEPIEHSQDDFVDFLEETGQGGNLSIVGHSKGALMTLLALGTQPERMKKIVGEGKVHLAGGPPPRWVNGGVGELYWLSMKMFGGDDFKFMERYKNGAINLDGFDITSYVNPQDPIIRGDGVGKVVNVTNSHSGMLFEERILGNVSKSVSEVGHTPVLSQTLPTAA